MVRQPFILRRFASLILSFIMLAVLLMVLWLGHSLGVAVPEAVTIREIAILTPPPPPPPPPTQQTRVDESVMMQVSGEGPVLQMVTIKETALDIVKPDMLAIDTSKVQWQSLEVDWDAFDLKDLDVLPTLLTPLRVTFPKSLTRKGVNFASVKLDILIDEQGQATLISVITNPYPELNTEIKKLVRNSRFTAPRKNNVTVRARFIWPIEIKS